MTTLSSEARDVIAARHSDPFHYLGPHRENDQTIVRVFLPEASQVVALAPDGSERELSQLDPAGLFAGPVGSERYRLRARFGEQEVEFEDPYRFPPVLSDFDLYLLGEGNHLRLYDKLGAHPMEMDGIAGVAFAVWASSATSICGMAAVTPCASAAMAGGRFSCPAPGPATSTNTRSLAATGRFNR
jgi:1,4-alpha-glucan branching enzyme